MKLKNGNGNKVEEKRICVYFDEIKTKDAIERLHELLRKEILNKKKLDGKCSEFNCVKIFLLLLLLLLI